LNPRQLIQQNAQPLRTRRQLQLQQLFYREAVGEIVSHRAQIVDAIRERHHLLIKLRLARLLDAGVQVADVRRDVDDDFAVDLEHQSQHAVRRRMLRAHVEDHGAVPSLN